MEESRRERTRLAREFEAKVVLARVTPYLAEVRRDCLAGGASEQDLMFTRERNNSRTVAVRVRGVIVAVVHDDRRTGLILMGVAGMAGNMLMETVIDGGWYGRYTPERLRQRVGEVMAMDPAGCRLSLDYCQSCNRRATYHDQHRSTCAIHGPEIILLDTAAASDPGGELAASSMVGFRALHDFSPLPRVEDGGDLRLYAAWHSAIMELEVRGERPLYWPVPVPGIARWEWDGARFTPRHANGSPVRSAQVVDVNGQLIDAIVTIGPEDLLDDDWSDSPDLYVAVRHAFGLGLPSDIVGGSPVTHLGELRQAIVAQGLGDDGLDVFTNYNAQHVMLPDPPLRAHGKQDLSDFFPGVVKLRPWPDGPRGWTWWVRMGDGETTLEGKNRHEGGFRTASLNKARLVQFQETRRLFGGYEVDAALYRAIFEEKLNKHATQATGHEGDSIGLGEPEMDDDYEDIEQYEETAREQGRQEERDRVCTILRVLDEDLARLNGQHAVGVRRDLRRAFACIDDPGLTPAEYERTALDSLLDEIDGELIAAAENNANWGDQYVGPWPRLVTVSGWLRGLVEKYREGGA